jgi:hypothetical protein
VAAAGVREGCHGVSAGVPIPYVRKWTCFGEEAGGKEARTDRQGCPGEGQEGIGGKLGSFLEVPGADSSYGVTRGTVKAISNTLGLTETQVVHIVLSRQSLFG